MVSHANVLHYVDYITKRYGFESNDRVSQTFDLTFDLSAHDMFVTWATWCMPLCSDPEANDQTRRVPE